MVVLDLRIVFHKLSKFVWMFAQAEKNQKMFLTMAIIFQNLPNSLTDTLYCNNAYEMMVENYWSYLYSYFSISTFESLDFCFCGMIFNLDLRVGYAFRFEKANEFKIEPRSHNNQKHSVEPQIFVKYVNTWIELAQHYSETLSH